MKVLTNNQYYSDIADTIRQMKGVATTYKPREMASALRDMYSTEVEGAPPLTFPSNGNNLLNYRIDGANGGVGDRTANLLDYNWLFDYEQKKVNEYFNYIQITLEPNTTYNVTSDYNYNQAQDATAFIVVNSNTAITTANGGVFGSLTVTTTQDGILKIARRIKGNNETMVPKREDFENNSKHIQISINSVNDENYEPYGKYKVPAIISGKNLLNTSNANTTIVNGVTSYRSNGFYYLSGTNTKTDATWILPNTQNTQNTNLPTFEIGQTYTMSFKGTLPSGIYAQLNGVKTSTGTQYSIGSVRNTVPSVTFTIDSDYSTTAQLFVGIQGATTNVDCNFAIQIEKGSTATSYEPYIEPTTTNIYLDEPIGANESKSLSDTNVNIPTINGTNILSIDTTVQPSNVYVQAPKTNNYNP